ncbi:MAG TPA: CoA ester lyase [Arthrobacter sp.]|nr:CoA ester lyase [Arthrobacter sp.]
MTGPAPAVSPLAASAVTALFVPGDRPERFTKAAASGADIIIIDLEDAVAPGSKAAARAAAVGALSASDGGVRALVRINPAGTEAFGADLSALLAGGPPAGLLGVVLAKAETAADVEHLLGVLPAGLAVIPLVESALGLREADALASVIGVTRLAFGAIDFALDINSASEEQYLAYARSRLVVASRAAGIAAPLDSPSTEIRDAEAVAASAAHANGFGFGGKLCIHPAQLGPVADAFGPTAEETAWARTVLAADGDAGGAAVQLDGKMIDAPVVERARRILQLAGFQSGQEQ